ncbi:Pyrrolo-quinoline quinone, partial [mine drainage metagenome]
GKVDAQPLYVSAVRIHDRPVAVLYVATEADRLYALNAQTGAILWEDTLLRAGETPSDDRHCSQVRPTIGVTATPVIDLRDGRRGTIFAVAMSKDPQGHYHQRLYALDLATGAERRSSPVTIRASYPGTGDGSDDGHVLFNPAQYKERPGLLLLRGVVYTFWSSNCDHRPYTGWVIGYAAHGLRSKRVLDLTPNGHDGAIWASGAGPAAGPGGHIYFLDGNGSFGRRFDSRGFPIDHDFGNAFIRLSVSGGRIRVSDYFNMDHTRAESRAD